MRLLESDAARAERNEGQIFSAEIGWYRVDVFYAPCDVCFLRTLQGIFCFYGVKTKLEIRNEK